MSNWARPTKRRSGLRRSPRGTALIPLLGLLAMTAIALQPTAAEPAEPPENLLTNPGFETLDADGFPACWQKAGWGDSTAAYTVTDAAHSGSRALRLAVSDWTQGDRKIMVKETEACAPTVAEGAQYDLTAWYTSTTENTVFTAFRHDTTQGWVYWTDLKTLPPTDSYTRAEVRTPSIPPNTDRIAWGVTLFGGNGTLTLDDVRMTQVADQQPPSVCEPGEQCPQGSWEVQPLDPRARAMHFVLLHNGKVLMIAGSGNDTDRFAAGTFTSHLYAPATGQLTDVETPEDLFCAGHVQLRDGRVLVMGGNLDYTDPDGAHGYKGLKNSYLFDPETNQYTRVNDLNTGHWYPSATVLGNGDVLSLGGLDENSQGTVTVEYFSDAQQRWLGTGEINQTWSYWGLYPSMILLQDGKLFYSGSHVFGNGLPGTGASVYDYGAGTITDVPGLRKKDERDQSMSVLLPPAQSQRVATFGGGNVDSNPDANRLTDLIDLSVPSPAYTAGPDLPQGHYSDGRPQSGDQGKMYVSAVLLPDGTVLETGGALHNRADPVHETSVFDPATGSFTQVAPDPEPRGYHSGSLLLPDGRVLSYGDNPGNNTYNTNLSIYSPPYLSKGPRPQVASLASTTWTYGSEQRITVDSENPIAKAALIRPEAVTHSSDPNQRYVDLPMTVDGDGIGLNLTGNPNLAPPGWYMLFVTDSAGVPSVARWVKIEGEEQTARVLEGDVSQQAIGDHTASAPAAPSGRPAARKPAKDLPVSVNGCVPGYGEPGQCVPSTFPDVIHGDAAHAGDHGNNAEKAKSAGHTRNAESAKSTEKAAAKCRWLDGKGWKPFPVHGRDPHKLDANRDHIACGRGDPGGPIG